LTSSSFAFWSLDAAAERQVAVAADHALDHGRLRRDVETRALDRDVGARTGGDGCSSYGERDEPRRRAWPARSELVDCYRGEGAPVFASAARTPLSRPNLAGRVLKPAGGGCGARRARRGRRAGPLGELPPLPAHPRLVALRRWPEREAGRRMAGTRRPRVHAPNPCPPDGRGSRRCGLLDDLVSAEPIPSAANER
jgi:hypothetical protein